MVSRQAHVGYRHHAERLFRDVVGRKSVSRAVEAVFADAVGQPVRTETASQNATK